MSVNAVNAYNKLAISNQAQSYVLNYYFLISKNDLGVYDDENNFLPKYEWVDKFIMSIEEPLTIEVEDDLVNDIKILTEFHKELFDLARGTITDVEPLLLMMVVELANEIASLFDIELGDEE